MPSAEPIYLIIFTTGLTVGFGHCIGMCGPIVVSFSLNLKKRSTFLPHLLYNGGRLTTYSVLGGFMGLTGSFVTITSSIANVQKGVMIFAGALIIVMGIAMGGWIRLGGVFGDYYKPDGFISKGFKKLSVSKSSLIFYPLGLLLGLLPCGPVYTALIAAATLSTAGATSSFQGFFIGVGVMLAFGLGTVPALFLVAKLADLGWVRSREVIYRIGSVLMVVVGIYFLIQGIR